MKVRGFFYFYILMAFDCFSLQCLAQTSHVLDEKNEFVIYEDYLNSKPSIGRVDFYSKEVEAELLQKTNNKRPNRVQVIVPGDKLHSSYWKNKKLAKADYVVHRIKETGSSDNRIDLVFMGDGFIEEELPTYNQQARNLASFLFTIAPLYEYRELFNIYMIDVISSTSGVPREGLGIAGALRTYTNCDGISRRYCVNSFSHIFSVADQVEGRDSIFIIGNSSNHAAATAYPGLGVALVTNSSEAIMRETAVHEFGHSFGNLADEYIADEGRSCDPWQWPNISPTNNVEYLSSLNLKWINWLDVPGTGFFPGGCGSTNFDIYRPTNSSLMSTRFDFDFKEVNREQLVMRVYEKVDPIDSATEEGVFDDLSTVLSVQSIPVESSIKTQWYMSNAFGEDIPILGATSNFIRLADIGLPEGYHKISVKVWDDTKFVRNEEFREEFMTSRREWYVQVDEVSAAVPVIHSVSLGPSNEVFLERPEEGVYRYLRHSPNKYLQFSTSNAAICFYGSVSVPCNGAWDFAKVFLESKPSAKDIFCRSGTVEFVAYDVNQNYASRTYFNYCPALKNWCLFGPKQHRGEREFCEI